MTMLDFIHGVPNLLPSSISLFFGPLAVGFLVLAITKKNNDRLCSTFQILSLICVFGFMPFLFKVILSQCG